MAVYTRVSGTWREVGSSGPDTGGGGTAYLGFVCAPSTGGQTSDQNWTSAVNWCNNLTLNGYSDWVLPGKSELDTLYSLSGLFGGFAVSFYWSSTEANSSNAWSLAFSNGTIVNRNKTGRDYVRAVRRLTL